MSKLLAGNHIKQCTAIIEKKIGSVRPSHKLSLRILALHNEFTQCFKVSELLAGNHLKQCKEDRTKRESKSKINVKSVDYLRDFDSDDFRIVRFDVWSFCSRVWWTI